MDFDAGYLEIEPRELVSYLLRESGQGNRDAVNPEDLLSFLHLKFATFDFDTALPGEVRGEGVRPRALLSFPDRIVAAHSGMADHRLRFSVLHEIGHYVLPNHQHGLYLCDEQGLGFSARLTLEREANEFAAALLFQGDRFTLEANSHPTSAWTVKILAEKYKASYEATARRLVEQSLRPCMLIVFKASDGRGRINPDATPVWTKKYTIASPPFKTQHFADLRSAVLPAGLAAIVTAPGRDIAESHECDVTVGDPSGKRIPLHGEFFYNQYAILALLTPRRS